MTEIDLVVFGSGSLTRSLAIALASRSQPSLSTLIVGRDEAAVASIAMLARARAAALNTSLTIRSCACDYSSPALDGIFSAVRPRIVLTLASRQSPWKMGPRWRDLLSVTGYGFTLPLQAVLADHVFRAGLQRHAALCVNGCYPDVANHVLLDRGIPIVGGIGNVAIIASVLRSLHPGRSVAVIAHHSHVAALISGRWNGLSPPAVWLDGERWPEQDAVTLTNRVVFPPDSSLNDVTGAAAVPMLEALAGRSDPWNGHAPGVNGELGGYPVCADTRGLRLSLPADVSPDDARALNNDFGRADGLTIEKREYRCMKTADEVRRATGIQLPESIFRWQAQKLDEQANRLGELRAALDPI
jgi:hypothetical protein